MLEARQIVKTIGGLRVLDEARFRLLQGEVHALIGAPRAGKSMLVEILAGLRRPDSGQIRMYGELVRFGGPRDAVAQGIAAVLQEPNVAEKMSVAENILPGRQPVGRLGFIDFRMLYQQAGRLIDWFGARIDPAAGVGQLSSAEQRVVEILRIVSLHPRVMLLDQPTRQLDPPLVELLVEAVKRLKTQGMSLLYATDQMQEVLALADRVTVFRDGRYVETRQVTEVTQNWLEAMVAAAVHPEDQSQVRST